jgi:hypothetical protein
MKGLIYLICIGSFFNASAHDKIRASDVIDTATEILWYDCDKGEAIVYAQFAAFFVLKESLKQIVSSEPIGAFDVLDPNADYNFLYFDFEGAKSPAQSAILFEDTLVMSGQVYAFEKSVMDNWRYHNDKRISFNEAVKWVTRVMDDDSLNYCGVEKRSNE